MVFPRAVSSPGWLLATPCLPSEVMHPPCWHGPPSSLLRASPPQRPSGTPLPKTGSPLIFFSPNALLFLCADPSTVYNDQINCSVAAGPPPIPRLSSEAPGLFIHHLKSTLVAGVLLSDAVPPCTCGPHEPTACVRMLWAPRAPDSAGPGDVGGTPFCH